MLFKKLIVFLLLIPVTAYHVLADTFIVTSNADDGPGSLRVALKLAAANGSADPDRIEFNLPDISEAGRTIKLLSQLPDVSSNLVIDGSTQPGLKFGISDAKVGLFYEATVTGAFSGLRIMEQNSVKIFGLHIKFLANPLQPYTSYNTIGIEISNGKDFQIGDFGVGNVITGFNSPITTNEKPIVGGVNRNYLTNLIIKSNILGLDADGSSYAANYEGMTTLNTLLGQMVFERNVFFKGLSVRQNNAYDEPNIRVELYQTLPADMVIRNNKIGVNFDASVAGTGTFGGLMLSNSQSDGKNTYHIEDNVINSPSFYAINISGNRFPVYILRNYIGVDKTLQKHLKTGGIYFNGVLQANIGSADPADANYIAHCKPVTVTSSMANFPTKVSVNKNSFFCTEDAYPMYSRTEGVFIPAISILSSTPTSVKGTATPNSSVELFYSDLCGTCSPETYFASVTADANGNWEYNGTILRTVIASATINGNTSEFTKLDIDVSSVKVINACNGLGSITGVVPKSATGFKWVDENGNTVATTADLLNVPVGKYKMVAQNGTCSAESIYFQIVDALQIISTSIQIKNSSCSNADGTITGLTVSNSTTGQAKFSWKNGSGLEISTALDLKNITTGDYTLTVTTADGSCSQSYGPVNIQNTTGPNINQSQIAITPTNCGQAIGSIAGITATGSGTLIYTWKNTQQQVVGNTANLLSQPAGVYTLEVKDGGACGPVFSSAITIPELNGITLNETDVLLVPASCNKSNGGIKDITATGATTYAWYNSSNVLVANSADLSGVTPGNYYLIASNTTCSKQSKTYTVIQDVDVITASAIPVIINDECGQNKGSITGLKLSGGLPPFNYQWTNAANNVVSTTANANNLGAGTYTLIVTDGSACGAFSATYTIQNQTIIIPAPVVNDVKICNSGSVLLAVNNTSSTYGYKLYDSNNSMTALDDNKSGKFSVNVSTNRSYYISQYIGQCESARTEVKVRVGISALDIANAFTPNGDGINDVWKIKGMENTPFATVQVFNRNGLLVFESKGYNQPFDGTMKNQPLTSGAYYYIINMGTACNIITGSLTIIR